MALIMFRDVVLLYAARFVGALFAVWIGNELLQCQIQWTKDALYQDYLIGAMACFIMTVVLVNLWVTEHVPPDGVYPNFNDIVRDVYHEHDVDQYEYYDDDGEEANRIKRRRTGL